MTGDGDGNNKRPVFLVNPSVNGRGSTHSTTGSTVSALLVTALFIVCAILLYMYIRHKSNSGKFNIR